MVPTLVCLMLGGAAVTWFKMIFPLTRPVPLPEQRNEARSGEAVLGGLEAMKAATLTDQSFSSSLRNLMVAIGETPAGIPNNAGVGVASVHRANL